MSGHTHLWGGVTEKLQNITINNVEGETSPLYSEKKMMIYSHNMIAQKSTFYVISQPNKWLHSWATRKQIKMAKNSNQQW